MVQKKYKGWTKCYHNNLKESNKLHRKLQLLQFEHKQFILSDVHNQISSKTHMDRTFQFITVRSHDMRSCLLYTYVSAKFNSVITNLELFVHEDHANNRNEVYGDHHF